MPPPINSHWDRCRGDASASRGNHTRGTETTRPSVSVTESASIEHDTSTASVSVFSVKVAIPTLFHPRSSVFIGGHSLGPFSQLPAPHSSPARSRSAPAPRSSRPPSALPVPLRDFLSSAYSPPAEPLGTGPD